MHDAGFRKTLVLTLMLCLALVSTAAQADESGTRPSADFSGIEPFFAVADLLAAGEEVPDAAWERLFASPAYRVLHDRENADRFLMRLLPRAMSSAARASEATSEAAGEMTGASVGADLFVLHLRDAYAHRAELAAFRTELEGRPLVDEALQTTQTWLPAGAATRGAPPKIAFVIYQPDARGYDSIIFDLFLAYARPDVFEGILAHEAHHVLRGRLQGPRGQCWSDLPEADLLTAIDQLQAEGMADLIDKRALLAVDDWGTTGVDQAFSLLSDRFRGEMDLAQQRLAETDAILSVYAADPSSGAELGRRLRFEVLIMGSHPVGYHLARDMVAAGLGPRLIEHVADPFEFLRIYQEFARAENRQNGGAHHVFSDAALRGLADLEQAGRCDD